MQSAVTDYRLGLEGQLHIDWDCSQQLQIIDWDWRSRRMEVDEVVSQFGSLQTHDQVRFMSCNCVSSLDSSSFLI